MSDVKPGDQVLYRSFAGDVWDAVVVKVRSPTSVDVEVSGPGLKEPMPLTAVRWLDDPDSPLPGIRRKA